MAVLDVADALTVIKRLCRIPDVTEYPASADLYDFLRDGENRVKHDLGAVVPEILYNAPTLLTSADGGYTYPFGTDGGSNAVAPIGLVRVYPSKAHIPFEPLVANVEYVFEGTRIRMTQNVPVTYSDGPYAQWIAPTLAIDGSSNAFTLPVQLRMAAIHDACVRYARSGNIQDASQYEANYQEEIQRQIATAQLNRVGGKIAYPRPLVPWNYAPRFR